jgi:hypothetical protein
MQREIGSMTSEQLNAYRLSSLIGVLMLIAQFMLGMAVNLFVVIPKDHPGSNPPEYFSGVAQSVAWALLHGHVLLILHAALGLVLVFASIGTLAQAIRTRTRNLIVTAAVGAFGVIAAGFNGGSYLNYHEDFSSMIMATGFAVAMVAYVTGLYFLSRSPTASASR